MFKKLIGWFNSQSPNVKGYLIIIVILVIGIILRWDFILDSFSGEK